MNKEDPFRTKAEASRKRIVRVKPKIDSKVANDEGTFPSRSRYHKKKQKKKKKVKFKTPVISILAVIFIFIPIVVFSLNKTLGNNIVTSLSGETDDNNGFETVDVTRETDNETMSAKTAVKENTQEEQAKTTTEDKEKEKKQTTSTEQQKEQPKQEVKDQQEDSGKTAESQQEVKNQQEDNQKKEEETNKQSTNQKIIYHTVQMNDTLFDIAIKYYKSNKGMEIIKEANNLTSDSVVVGTKLKIPIEE